MIINLTPHAIVVDVDGVIATFEASGSVARVTTTLTQESPVMGIPVVTTTYGNVNFGCDIMDGNTYIVSAMVLSAIKTLGIKGDFVAPNTAQATRNEKGHIVSVPGFTK